MKPRHVAATLGLVVSLGVGGWSAVALAGGAHHHPGHCDTWQGCDTSSTASVPQTTPETIPPVTVTVTLPAPPVSVETLPAVTTTIASPAHGHATNGDDVVTHVIPCQTSKHGVKGKTSRPKKHKRSKRRGGVTGRYEHA